MTNQGPNLQQQTQDEQYLKEAQHFFGQSMGRVKAQVQNYRQQLEQYSQQVPDGDAKAQIDEMVDSYKEVEGSMDSAAQDEGVEDAMNQAAEQFQQSMGDLAQGAQDAAGQVTDQAQQVAGQATDQAGQVAGQAQDTAGQVTDQAGQAAGQVQDTVGASPAV